MPLGSLSPLDPSAASDCLDLGNMLWKEREARGGILDHEELAVAHRGPRDAAQADVVQLANERVVEAKALGAYKFARLDAFEREARSIAGQQTLIQRDDFGGL